MVPAGTEPHDWEPAAADIKNLEDADVSIYNGAGMEHWTEDGVPLLKAFTTFMGVFLQAVPFLILAFLLSLCSSSDAVVARSITGITNFIPALGFLVF